LAASTSTVPILIVFTVSVDWAFAFSELLTFTEATNKNKANITIRITNLVLAIVVSGILIVLLFNSDPDFYILFHINLLYIILSHFFKSFSI
jgi:hypothetical protein